MATNDHSPEKAACAVIDAHNHLWGSRKIDHVVEVMDRVGVVGYCDVTANVHIAFAEGGYVISQGDIREFFANVAGAHPGRFYCFTMSEFAHPADEPLFDDADAFVERCIETLNEHVGMGAKGLKILKELGLHYRDSRGHLITVDDERLIPIWQEAARLKVPVLMHQADPSGFFEPVTPDNEHYESLKKFPSWSYADKKFPRKQELLARRDRLIGRHPDTIFILPHVANFAEDLDAVSALLDEHPNVYIDFSARLDELGRKPEAAREFFIRYQDRILFGSDMPADIDSSVDMYRCYFRFLETYDEGFTSPDYDGTFDRSRWPICGIGLGKEVLEKIYTKNVLKVIPSLKEELKNYLPGK